MILELAIILSILGAFAVTVGKSDLANIIWSISNPAIFLHNIAIGDKPQALLFLVFTALAWSGALIFIYKSRKCL